MTNYIFRIQMGRAGKKNITLKYLCCVEVAGEEIHNKQYASLIQIGQDLNIPYHTLTDVYEGRRSSFTKYQNMKFFPTVKISLITEIEKGQL